MMFWSSVTSFFCDASKNDVMNCMLVLRNIGIIVPRILSFISNYLIVIAI